MKGLLLLTKIQSSKFPETYIQPDEEDKGVMQAILHGETIHNNNKNIPFKLAFSIRQLYPEEIDTWNIMNIGNILINELKYLDF